MDSAVAADRIITNASSIRRMPADYDRDRVVECMFDPTTSLILAELEDGARTCSHLAGVASIPEPEVTERLRYLIECGFIKSGTDEDGNATLEADPERLSEIVEDSDNFGAAVDGLAKMDSYLN